jgi:ADP-ribose pyrophosphatase YjhB (NUDIX family)
MNIEAAMERLKAEGGFHHWFKKDERSLEEWKNEDPIGFDEFAAVAERIVRAGTGYLPTVVCCLVLEESGGLILVKRSDWNKWALPGGIQDPGESWQMTAVREVFEETGHQINQVTIIDVATVPECNIIFCYSNHIKYDSTLLFDQNEIELVALMNSAPAEDKIAFPTHAQIIKRYFDQMNGN